MSKTRSSLTLVIALLALLVATVGAAPAFAAALTKAQKTEVTKIAKKQAAKVVKQQSKTLTVAKAKTADSATTAATATTATTATTALSPVAYAVVNADGSVVNGFAKGITDDNVALRDISAFCFDVPFAFKTLQATPTYIGLNDDVSTKTSTRSYGTIGDSCEAADDALVATAVNDNFAAHGFTVWFYN